MPRFIEFIPRDKCHSDKQDKESFTESVKLIIASDQADLKETVAMLLETAKKREYTDNSGKKRWETIWYGDRHSFENTTDSGTITNSVVYLNSKKDRVDAVVKDLEPAEAEAILAELESF